MLKNPSATMMPHDYVLPATRSMGLSASKIESFHQCKAKFRAEFIHKSIPFIETEETRKGKKIHSVLENAVLSSGMSIETLNEDYKLNEFTLNKLYGVLAANGQKFAEFKFGITDDMNQCVQLNANWDKQPNKQPYLYTGSMDVRVVNGIYTTIIDWKTGRVYKPYTGPAGKFAAEKSVLEKSISEKKLQFDMYALAEFMLNPQCQYIKAIYVFTEYDKDMPFMYSREEDFARLREMFFDEAKLIWWSINTWTQSAAEGKTGIMLESVTPLCGWCGIRENCIPFNRSLGAK